MPPRGKHPRVGYFTGPLPCVNLRCEWCKGLFQWQPAAVYQIVKNYRRTCCDSCAGKLISWEAEKRRKAGDAQ